MSFDYNLYEKICDLSINENADFALKYDDLADLGYKDFSFQYEGKSFVLRLILNLPAQRLYFSVLDNVGNGVQIFQPLLNYPLNNFVSKDLINAELFFYENAVYYREITE